jgi:zinc protease|tara:strand:+ start:115233 stop:118127 length:2895 start_codon:yes stop_codon:yes gene_type:complete
MQNSKSSPAFSIQVTRQLNYLVAVLAMILFPFSFSWAQGNQDRVAAQDNGHAQTDVTTPETASPAATPDWPAGVTAGPAVEGTQQYTLENGLTVLLSPDTSKASVTVNMTYLVGSRHENYGQTGMAHLLEHMLFRGTPSLPNALAEFSKRGLRANGSTSSDRTNYYATFASDPELLEWYLRWQADVMVNATISRADLDAEMTVVRNEMEAGENSPFESLMQKVQSAAYQWHSYGNDTIGARSDVENVDIEQLRAFYRLYYQPDNAVLIVSGRFEPGETLSLINDAFKAIPRPERPLPTEYTVEPVQQGEQEVIVRRSGGTPLVIAQYHIPAAASPEFVALDLGAMILSDTPSGRLYKALVQNDLAAHTFGFARPMRQPGYALFGAQLENGMNADKALDTLTQTLEDLNTRPFTSEELERVRTQWMTSWSETHSDPASLASALSESAALGDWRLFYWMREQAQNADLQTVQDLASAYLVPSNRTAGLYIPTQSTERAPKPGATDPAVLLKDFKGRETQDLTGAFDATPENIDAQTLRETIALHNGTLEVALLPKPTRGNRVEARLLLQSGDAEALKGLRNVSSAAAALLTRGTSQYSRQEIADRFDQLQAQVSFGGGGNQVGVNISVPGENLPEVIALVGHILREASYPAEELERYKSQARASIESAMTEPGSVASRTLARHDNPWPSSDIRYVPTFQEALKEINALNREALIDFHQRFYGAATLRFSAVGAFDPKDTQASLVQAFKDWKAAPEYQRIGHPFRSITPEQFTLHTPDKANAVFMAFQPLELQDDDPAYTALYVANYILGGSSSSRLWTRIRVEEGISYNVGSSIDASAYEPSGEWSLSAILAPENAPRFRKALNEELNRALTDGFSQEELDEAIRALMNLRRLNRSNDGVLASVWLDYMQADRSFAWSAKIDKELETLSLEQTNAAARKYLQSQALSSALAGEFPDQANAESNKRE